MLTFQYKPARSFKASTTSSFCARCRGPFAQLAWQTFEWWNGKDKSSGQFKTQTVNCRLQTADGRLRAKCRPRVKCRVQTRGNIQIAERRPRVIISILWRANRNISELTSVIFRQTRALFCLIEAQTFTFWYFHYWAYASYSEWIFEFRLARIAISLNNTQISWSVTLLLKD